MIGNGDTTLSPATDDSYRRWTGLALTDQHGVVPDGAVGDDAARTRPGGAVRAASRRRTRARRVRSRVVEGRALGGPHRSVVVVEASDLLRLQAYSSFASTAARTVMQQRVFDQLDALGRRAPAASRSAHDAVLVVGAVAAGRPGPVDGCEPRRARRETRARGVELDAALGHRLDRRHRADDPRPARHRSASRHGGPPDRVRALGRLVRRAAASGWSTPTRPRSSATGRSRRSPSWFVVLQILLTAARVGRVRALRRRAQVVDRARARSRCSASSPRPISQGCCRSTGTARGRTGCSCSGSGSRSRCCRGSPTDRAGVTTLIVALSIVVGLIVVDVATGSRLQFNTVFGYSPTVAGRFAGLGNLGYSQLAAGTVLLAGLRRVPRRRSARVSASRSR